MNEADAKSPRRGRPRGVAVDGSSIREWRQRGGWTLKEVADATGLSERTLRTVERGGAVSAGTIRTLAKHTGIPFASLALNQSRDVNARLVEFGLAPAAPSESSVPRRRLIERMLDQIRSDRPGVVCITGRSGIGKTWLAQAIAHEATELFADGVLWINGAATDSIDHRVAVQRRIADALRFSVDLPSVDLVGETSFHTIFSRLLWERDRLLIVDDLPTSRVLRHFIDANRARVIVTTRYRHVAEAYAPYTCFLDAFDEEDALRVLCQSVPRARFESEPDATRALLRLVDGVPRSLHIAGRVLAREPYTSVRDFADRVMEDPTTLLPLGIRDHSTSPWGRDEASEVRRSREFDLDLSSEARTLHSHLAVFGVRSFSAAWAAAASPMAEGVLTRSLAELTNHFLLREFRGPESDAEPSANDQIRFRFDRHSVLTAKARNSNAILDALDHLTAYAERLVEGPTLRTVCAQVSAFDIDRGAWTTTLDRSAELVLQHTGPVDSTSPQWIDRVAGSLGIDTITARLPRIVLGLAPLLTHRIVPDADRWVAAATLVAVASQNVRQVARLATINALRMLQVSLDVGAFDTWISRASIAYGEANDSASCLTAATLRARLLLFSGSTRLARELLEQSSAAMSTLDLPRLTEAAIWHDLAVATARTDAYTKNVSTYLRRAIRAASLSTLVASIYRFNEAVLANGREAAAASEVAQDALRATREHPMAHARLLAFVATHHPSIGPLDRKSMWSTARSLWRNAILECEPAEACAISLEIGQWVLEACISDDQAPELVVVAIFSLGAERGGLDEITETRVAPGPLGALVPGMLIPRACLRELVDSETLHVMHAFFVQVSGADHPTAIAMKTRLLDVTPPPNPDVGQ